MELATPISVYWDLPPQSADRGYLLRIADDILASRPLMLHLSAPGPNPWETAVPILQRFAQAPFSIYLTIPVEAVGCTNGAILRSPNLREILLAVTDAQALHRVRSALNAFPPPGAGAVHGRQEGGVSATPGISCGVTHENWRDLPSLVSFCRAERIPRLVLPMQRLYHGEQPFSLNRSEQEELAGMLTTTCGPEGPSLTIHDPFLWRAFNPGRPFPQGGCQAANTMIAIAPDGAVYPCPSLPLLLGTIGDSSLSDIVASAEKKELRNRLLPQPARCRDCGELAVCRGGCRGRSYAVTGSLDAIDPACR
jgi:GeoRSP system SPASM domain protein